jgi:hypothetical protein
VANSSANLEHRRLRVSSYDRAWSGLLALLFFFGSAVFILFMIWLSNQMHETEIARPVEMVEVGDGEGGGDGRPSGGTQLESPDNSSEPMPNIESEAPDVADTIASVTETVVEQVAMLDDPALQPPKAKGDYGTGGGSGGGNGPGRGLGHGPGRPGLPQRWQIKFDKGDTIEKYAKKLDFFKMELCVSAGNEKFIYLSNFSAKVPTKREGNRVDDKRMFFVWQGGDLKQADLEFFRRAKVDVSKGKGRIFLFINKDIEQKLLELETSHQNKKINEIKYTHFGILSDGAGYKFNVIKQLLK